jgi:hypothetical protein
LKYNGGDVSTAAPPPRPDPSSSLPDADLLAVLGAAEVDAKQNPAAAQVAPD